MQPKERIPFANRGTESPGTAAASSSVPPDSRTSITCNQKARAVLVNDVDMCERNRQKKGWKYNIDVLRDFREIIVFHCDARVAAMLLARTAYYYPEASITCHWSAGSDLSNSGPMGLC